MALAPIHHTREIRALARRTLHSLDFVTDVLSIDESASAMGDSTRATSLSLSSQKLSRRDPPSQKLLRPCPPPRRSAPATDRAMRSRAHSNCDRNPACRTMGQSVGGCATRINAGIGTTARPIANCPARPAVVGPNHHTRSRVAFAIGNRRNRDPIRPRLSMDPSRARQCGIQVDGDVVPPSRSLHSACVRCAYAHR